ncbi:hypothetical protein QQF64_022317 [Cirrhinus molitorella]|uniref:Secreted protein n=1 Tax=Cirrhinus molitorella TaxID=172907 RepID=A0ABR3LBC2_9TELE
MKRCRFGDSVLPSPLLSPAVSSSTSSAAPSEPAATIFVTDSSLSQWLIRSRVPVGILTNSKRSRRRFRVGRCRGTISFHLTNMVWLVFPETMRCRQS